MTAVPAEAFAPIKDPKEVKIDAVLKKLAEPFPPTDLEWRIGRSGVKEEKIWATCLAYVTSRAIMQRLDDVVGPSRWKNECPKEWGIGSPGVVMGLSIKIAGEWVTKYDGADQPDTEPVKGGFSNALKRVAVLWGIGRYLYDLPEGHAKISESGRHYQPASKPKGDRSPVPAFKWDPPALPKWALPEVEE